MLNLYLSYSQNYLEMNQMAQYKEIVNDFVNTDMYLGELFSLPKYEGDFFVKTLLSLYQIGNITEPNLKAKVFEDAEAIEKIDFDPLAKFLFYMMWSHASLHTGLMDQTELLIQKEAKILPEGAPPIFLSSLNIFKAYLSGSRPKYLEQILIECKKFGHSSTRYRRLIDNYLLAKCSAGIAASQNAEDNDLENFKNKITAPKDLYYYQFYNDVETCNFKSSQTYFDKIDKSIPLIKIILALYDLLKDKKIEIELKAETVYPDFLNNVLQMNLHLLKQELKEAIGIYQKVKNHSMWGAISSNFIGYSNIRVELCNKNSEAAFQLLKSKIKAGDAHYLDDFFLARVELLNGNREKAQQYFSKVNQNSEKYLASNRLQLELDMALEIKPSDLFYLTKKLNTSKTEIAKTNYDEILKPEKLFGVNRLIGESEAIKNIKLNIKSYATIEVPVLIRGETGVGKEIVARALHEESPRNKAPFLAINCGAIAESILQSELFGHLAGAYTGAISSHKGIFQEAGTGTVFLDEIGEISPAIQVALLRVLENNEVRPVGGSNQIPFHCKILAATNANLEELVKMKKFREDLYYRLKRLEIIIPPLRSRNIDVMPIVQYTLKTLRQSSESPTITEPLQNALRHYEWPGNVRQLRNEIEKMDLLQSRKSNYDLVDCDFLKEIKLPDSIKIAKNAEPEEVTLTPWRRLEKVKKLFTENKDLTRKEIAKKLQISLPTATTDLKKLLEEKYILKIEPSTSPRSHYFIINPKR